MVRKEKGVYQFMTPKGEFGQHSVWYRTMAERGDYASISRVMHPEYTMVGCPYYPWMEEDLRPKKKFESEIKNIWNKNHWMSEGISSFSRYTIIKAKKIFEFFKEEVMEDYVPVCWGENVKELCDKSTDIIQISPRMSIPIYNIAVCSVKDRHGDVLTVVWMRRSFLREFKSGQNIINVYRMMKKVRDVYGIPPYPYR